MSNKCQWVKTSERLPTKNKNYVCIVEVEDEGLKYHPVTFVTFSEGWINPSVCGTVGEVIEWLDEEDNAELSHLQKPTENLSKIADKDKWLKEVRGEEMCVAGCKTFTGGEKKHHPDCQFYPDSLSKMYDEMQELLLQAKYQLEAIDNQFPTKGTKAVIQEIDNNFLK